MYICKYCGKEFESGPKLGGHIIRCKLNPNYEKNRKNCCNWNRGINKNKSLIGKKEKCQFCGKEYAYYGLKTHEKYCSLNPNKAEYPKESHEGIPSWNKGLTAKDDERVRNNVKGIKKYYETHDGTWKNKHLSEEMKDKIRIGKTEYLKSIIDWSTARVSKNGCKYMDKLNEERNWHLQHGMNGGEVTCIGYFLDGYDKDLNIVFEYDESFHYKDVINNILNDRDIERQNKIINELHCEFWRYNEAMDLLYRVN